MNTKSKIAISISLVCVLIATAVVAVVGIWAATRQSFTSTINVRYTAMEVNGTASAQWKVGESGEWNDMTTSSGGTVLEFGKTALPANTTLQPKEDYIDLTSSNPFVVFKYTFTNSGSTDYAIDLLYSDDSIADENISVFSLNSDTEIESDFENSITTAYGNFTTTSIKKSAEKYVYILARVEDIYSKVSYSGSFSFQLDGKDYSGDLSFTPNGANYTVTALNSNLTTLRIPSTFNGGAVTEIEAEAFSGQSSLETVTIPDSVETIGENAFYGCENIKYIQLPFVGGSKDAEEMTSESIFAYIFGSGDCEIDLSGELDDGTSGVFHIPSSITDVIITGGNIFYDAFDSCEYIESITLPSTLTSIGDYAFNGCFHLKNVTIENGVQTIGDYAFSNCSSLTSMTIPESVISIGAGAFSYCDNLNSVSIQDGVKSIGDDAFWSCSSLTSITIPGSVTSIGESAFAGCDGLTNLTIENGVQRIGDSAFSDCVSLTSVTIPRSVETIEGDAFVSCSKLKSVIIESASVYKSAINDYAIGRLLELASGGTVRVPTSIVNANTNTYLNGSSFTKSTDGDYTVFTKK